MKSDTQELNKLHIRGKYIFREVKYPGKSNIPGRWRHSAQPLLGTLRRRRRRGRRRRRRGGEEIGDFVRLGAEVDGGRRRRRRRYRRRRREKGGAEQPRLGSFSNPVP